MSHPLSRDCLDPCTLTVRQALLRSVTMRYAPTNPLGATCQLRLRIYGSLLMSMSFPPLLAYEYRRLVFSASLAPASDHFAVYIHTFTFHGCAKRLPPLKPFALATGCTLVSTASSGARSSQHRVALRLQPRQTYDFSLQMVLPPLTRFRTPPTPLRLLMLSPRSHEHPRTPRSRLDSSCTHLV